MRAALLAAVLAAPAAAAPPPGALVWLPSESFRQWSALDAAFRADSRLKLTVALTPAQAGPLVKAALGPWLENGRAELAVRAPGDPVLTWACGHPHAPRPQDALSHAVRGAEALKDKLGRAPSGFVPGAGALDAALAASLAPSGLVWALAGPYAPAEGPWAAAGRAAVVPARRAPPEPDATWAAPGATVYDETESTAPGSAFLAALATLRERPDEGWATVSELAAARPERLSASEFPAWPAWSPGWDLPPEDDAARSAWEAYGEAARAVERYQNSGAADLRLLDAAVEELRRAQAARFYRPGADPASLRAALRGVYKKLKVAAPEALFDGGSHASADGGGEGPTGARVLSGPGWLELRNPAKPLALRPILRDDAAPEPPAPSTPAAFGDGGVAADPWRLRSLRVEWDAAAVTMRLRVEKAYAGPPRPVFEFYLDLNRVIGAGRVPLLEGRGATASARDAWELALSVAGDQARLYRAGSRASPDELGVFPASWDALKGELTVRVPRAVLRGNPDRWGWIVVALAEDPARPDQAPAASLVAPDGSILLGVLGSLETQKAVLSRTAPRLPALRRDP